ncbi:hypothetical protein BKA69DRAFT_1062555 [Paraphysoderma sedebokerense]|nr:hypothetical protein BKA69DRAFT_1062555 [Paraphysoderma sedebokerense]
MIQTSGTTREIGQLVKVPHPTLVSNIRSFCRFFQFDLSSTSTQRQKFALLTPPTFDPHLIEIVLPLLTCNPLIASLTSSFNLKSSLQHGATVLMTTPSRFLMLADSTIGSLLKKETSIQYLLLGGEPFPFRQIERFLKMEEWDSELVVANMYGTTECSVWSSIHILRLSNVAFYRDYGIPIGEPLSDIQFELEMIGDDEAILHMGGPNRITFCDNGLISPRATGDIFRIYQANDSKVPWNSWNDTFLMFLGRNDNQIKRMGHRIQLEQLECIVLQIDNVKAAEFLHDPATTGLTAVIIPVTGVEDIGKY